MSWRTVVISNSAKLDYQMGFMVVRGRETTKIHIDEISLVLIESTAVSITAALLCELTKKKVKIIFCDEKRNPSSELISYYGSHDTSIKIRNQMTWTDAAKNEVWTEIVTEKINQQSILLAEYGLVASGLLEQYLAEMQVGDTTNREGHAAKVYFNALFGKDFTRTIDNSVNAALNYGYSIILSTFNREIVSNGYLTQIGIFHDNMFNQFNLGSDLMEPFRPLVDREVKKLNFTQFDKEEKLKMVDILNQRVTINGRQEYVSSAIKIYTRSVFDAINDQDVSLIKFYKYEL